MDDVRKIGAGGHDDENALDPAAGRIHCTIDIYSCEEALRRLNEYLDHELTEGERLVVIKHLELCKPCSSRFTFEQTLVISLREKASRLRLPDNLKEKLHRVLQQDSPE